MYALRFLSSHLSNTCEKKANDNTIQEEIVIRPVYVSIQTEGVQHPPLERLPGICPAPAPCVKNFGTFLGAKHHSHEVSGPGLEQMRSKKRVIVPSFQKWITTLS